MEFQEAFSLFFRSVVVVGVPCDPMYWPAVSTVAPRSWVCGHCSEKVGSNQGFVGGDPPDEYREAELWAAVMICPVCEKPTFFPGLDSDAYMPAPPPGKADLLLPEDVALLHREARLALQAGLYTSAVTVCRKLLAHSAVNQGAEAGLSFFKYVDYLLAKGIVSPGMKEWVDHIRKMGNAATHEIELVTSFDAERVLHFTEILLTIVHHAPAKFRESREPPEEPSKKPNPRW